MCATPADKKCWKCEEGIHPQAIICPYCRADVAGGAAAKTAAEDTEASSPSPFRFVAGTSIDQPVPTPLYSPAGAQAEVSKLSTPSEQPPKALPPARKMEKAPPLIEEEVSMKQTVLTICTILGGAVFFIFGLVLLLYSHEGTFSLHWKTSTWPFYLALSVPLLFLGWRNIRSL